MTFSGQSMRLWSIALLGLAGAAPLHAGIGVFEVPCAEATEARDCLISFDYMGGYPALAPQIPRILEGDILRMVTAERGGTSMFVIDLSLEDGGIPDIAHLEPSTPDTTWAVVAPDGGAVLTGREGYWRHWGEALATYGVDRTLVGTYTSAAAQAISAYAFSNAIAFDPDGTVRLTFRGEDAAGLAPLILGGRGEVTGNSGAGFMEHLERVLADDTDAWFGAGMTAVTGYGAAGQPFVEVRPETGAPRRLAQETDPLFRHRYIRPMLSPDNSRLAVIYSDTGDPDRTQLLVFDTERPGAIWSAVTGADVSFAWTADNRLVVINGGGERITLYRP